MDAGQASGHARQGCRGSGPGLRFAPALLLLAHGLSRGVPADHAASRRQDRQSPGAGRLADRQRVRLPRHCAVLLQGSRGRIQAVARGTLRDHRGSQRGLGQCLLVDGVQRLRAGRLAASGGRGGQPQRRAGLPVVLVGSGRGLQQGSVRRDEGGATRPSGDPQFHEPLHRLRPLRGGQNAGRRQLGFPIRSATSTSATSPTR